MKPDITEIRKDREINLLIEKGNEVLRELGYTELRGTRGKSSGDRWYDLKRAGLQKENH